jgi:hypothetical protein
MIRSNAASTERESEKFCAKGLDSPIAKQPVGQIRRQFARLAWAPAGHQPFTFARSYAVADFTSAILPIEKAATVVVGGQGAHAAN